MVVISGHGMFIYTFQRMDNWILKRHVSPVGSRESWCPRARFGGALGDGARRELWSASDGPRVFGRPCGWNHLDRDCGRWFLADDLAIGHKRRQMLDTASLHVADQGGEQYLPEHPEPERTMMTRAEPKPEATRLRELSPPIYARAPTRDRNGWQGDRAHRWRWPAH